MTGCNECFSGFLLWSINFACPELSPYLTTFQEPRIDSEESVPPAYLAWRADTTSKVIVPADHAGNRFLDSFKGLKIRALLLVIHPFENPLSGLLDAAQLSVRVYDAELSLKKPVLFL